MNTFVALAVVGLTSLLVGLVAMPFARRFGMRFGLVDLPRPGEAQDRPLPRSGGYAVMLAVLAGVLVSLPILDRLDVLEWRRIAGLAAGSLLILPIALIDDFKRLSPWPQLLGQVCIGLVTCGFGIQIDSISTPFGGNLPVVEWLVVPLTVVWIVGMINTINFADGIDGLAGGIGLISATTLFLVSVSFGQYSIAALPLTLVGALIAFLPWNFYPSRLILGTSGATLIGYLLAVLAIIGGAKIATALMVLGLPISDVATVIVYRLACRRSPFHGGDRAHLHHRLLALGLSQRQVVGVFYTLCVSFGALAITLPHIRVYGLIGQIVVIAGIILFVLSRQRASVATKANQSLERHS